MQIETLRLVQVRAGGPVLVVLPLGVRQEFRRDGAMLGVSFKFIRTAAEMEEGQAFYLTLYPHKEKEFWLWLHSWAIFIQRPSELGYSDEGYELPPLQVHYHEVATDYGAAGTEKDGQGERICQIVIIKHEVLDLVEGEVDETARGEGGFGSTGTGTGAEVSNVPPPTFDEYERAKTAAHDALDAAERAWYAYAGMLDVGPDRTRAFDIYENVRQAHRVGGMG